MRTLITRFSSVGSNRRSSGSGTSETQSSENNHGLPPLAPSQRQPTGSTLSASGSGAGAQGAPASSTSSNGGLNRANNGSNEQPVQRRQDEARGSMSRRRSSLLQTTLRESRQQDERPQSARHEKRRSTISSDVADAIRSELVDSDLAVGEEAKDQEEDGISLASPVRRSSTAQAPLRAGAGNETTTNARAFNRSSEKCSVTVSCIKVTLHNVLLLSLSATTIG